MCAGAADFKQKLQNDATFDPRLKKAVIKTVDVSYGGENGFNQAIELVRGWVSVCRCVLLRTVACRCVRLLPLARHAVARTPLRGMMYVCMHVVHTYIHHAPRRT